MGFVCFDTAEAPIKVFTLAPPPRRQLCLNVLDRPRGTACSARNYLLVWLISITILIFTISLAIRKCASWSSALITRRINVRIDVWSLAVSQTHIVMHSVWYSRECLVTSSPPYSYCPRSPSWQALAITKGRGENTTRYYGRKHRLTDTTFLLSSVQFRSSTHFHEFPWYL